MRRWLFGLAFLLVFPPTTSAGQASGEITSDAPIALLGTPRLVHEASPIYLLHHAFSDGSLAGTTYDGSLIEERIFRANDPSNPPECGTADEVTQVIVLTAEAAKPWQRITFQLQSGAAARLVFHEDVTFGSTAGEAQASEPVAYLGPNPYQYDATQGPGLAPNEAAAPVLPLQEFFVAPRKLLHTDARHEMDLHWGQLLATQEQRTHTYEATTYADHRDIPKPPPLPGTITCLGETIRLYHYAQNLTSLDIGQAGLQGTLDYYAGKTLLASPVATALPPEGYWWRKQANAFGDALAAYKLPATLLAGDDTVVTVEGKALFEHALGSVTFDGKIHEVSNRALTLGGEVTLQPTAQDQAGRRMTTRIGNDVNLFEAGSTSTSKLPYGTFALWGLGGAALLAGVAYWPALKLGATRLALYPLYVRLKKEDILENPLRDDILEAVQTEPGISASELGRRLSCGWGTLVYHLTVLERMQLLSSQREGRHKRFFVQGRINYSDKEAVGLLANPAARTILDAVRETPGIIQRDLGRRLGLTAGTIAWHVERLSAAGLVVKEQDGRVVRYYPSSKLLDLTKQLAA